MWLLDLLPENISGARIMTYGFDPELDGRTSDRGLKTLAIGLIDSLDNLRKTTESREAANVPLIFICHSLGGVVVKQVIFAL